MNFLISVEPYWKQSIQLHYMNTDSFVLSFNTNQEKFIEFSKQNKNEFDFSELDKSHELYNPSNKKVMGETKIGKSPVLVLDSFTAFRSMSYCFSYQRREAYIDLNGVVQKAKQKGIQNAPECEDYINSLFMSETTSATKYSIRSNYTTLPWRNKTN